jgi:hypothetical protein
MVSSNGFWHFSQRNSEWGMDTPLFCLLNRPDQRCAVGWPMLRPGLDDVNR